MLLYHMASPAIRQIRKRQVQYCKIFELRSTNVIKIEIECFDHGLVLLDKNTHVVDEPAICKRGENFS